MSYYAAVFGRNGWMTNINSSDFSEALREYHDAGEEIQCVAIGPSSAYAIISSSGKSNVYGPANFNKKITEIPTPNIKHITFGCSKQWAIIMKDGYCQCFLNPEPLEFINKYQGQISYVSLGNDTNDWIIGYGQNGYVTGTSTGWELKGFIRAMNGSGNKIKLVEIGNKDQWIVQYEGGIAYSYHVHIPEALKNRFEEPVQASKPTIKSFSLYGTIIPMNGCMSCAVLKEQNQNLTNKLKVNNANCNRNYNKKRKRENIDDDDDQQNEASRAPPRKRQKTESMKDDEINILKQKIKSMKEELEDDMEHIDSFNEKKLNELELKYETKMKLIKEAKESLMEDKLKCIACLINPKNIVIEGCNHLDLCDQCESKLEKKACPRCQKLYTSKIKLSNV